MLFFDWMIMCMQGSAECLPCVSRSTYDAPFDRLASSVLSHVCEDYSVRSRDLRGVFSDMEVPERKPVSRHTHGRSAALRNSASIFAEDLATSSCLQVKFIQASGSDQVRGREGTRTYHWIKDLNAIPSSLQHGERDLAVLVDVDYYQDMPRELARHPASYLLYTVQPSRAGRADGEYKYFFNKEGELVYQVSGGATYQHKVWNYSGDSVFVREKFLGITYSYTGYSIERKYVDDDHQLILLTPYKRFGFFGAQLAQRQLQGQELRRLDPIDGSFARIEGNVSRGATVSIARLGTHLAATVSSEVEAALRLTAETSKEFTRSMALSKMVGNKGGEGQAVGSEVMVAYFREKQARYNPISVRGDCVSTVEGARTYQFLIKLADFEPCKAAMKAFMHPLVNAAYVAGRCLGNDLRTVSKRVTELQGKEPKAPKLPPHIRLRAEFKVFGQLVKRVVGELHPLDVDEVYLRQSRPTQRRILENAENETDNGRAKAMQKAEAYSDPKDPRNITIMNGPSKREHSRVMYALYDVLKQLPWYAFGLSQKETAHAVASLCASARSHWLATDFSRMDGNVNEMARTFERIFVLTLFAPEHHAMILASMKSQTFLQVCTSFGVQYDSAWSRASGSPETSALNTVLNAFIFFLGWRLTLNPETGTWHTHEEAWAKLGLYGGDDGGTPDASKKKVEEAGVVMGQVVTCTEIARGERGVEFLARRYGPGVWDGEPNSCCDILRQVSKFHVTAHLTGVSNSQKLCEKSFAFSLSDAETPILGPLVTKVLSISGYTVNDFQNHLRIWNVSEASNAYPNHYEEWMMDIVTAEIPDWKHETYDKWVESATTLYDLLQAPSFTEERTPVVKTGLVEIEGDIIGSPEVTPPPPSKKKSAESKAGPKKRHRNRAEASKFRGNTNNRQAKTDDTQQTAAKPKRKSG